MIYQFGEKYSIDTENGELKYDGDPVSLTSKESKVLTLLVINAGCLVTAEQLIECLYSVDETPADPKDSIKGYVYRLRRKLGEDSRAPKYLKTEGHVGYRWISSTQSLDAQKQKFLLRQSEHLIDFDNRAGLGFCGRTQQWSWLIQSLASLKKQNGKGHGKQSGKLLFLRGPGGMGKTHLANVFAASSHRLGYRTTVVQCSEGEGAEALHVWVDAMLSLCAGVTDQKLQDFLKHESVEFASWVFTVTGRDSCGEILKGERASNQPLKDRHRFIRSAVNLFRKLVQHDNGVHVWVFEDLHRADRFSLQLLHSFSSRLSDLPLVILGTYRDGRKDLSEDYIQLFSSMQKNAFQSMTLEPFSKENIQNYLLMHGLSDFYQDWLDEIRVLTGGLPLFLKIWMQNQKKSSKKMIEEHLGRTSATELNPLIQSLLEGLSPACMDVLYTVALLGPSFSIAKLQSVIQKKPEEIIVAIEEAVDASLLSPSERIHQFHFNHDLLRQGLIKSLCQSEKTKRHLQIAEGLNQFYETLTPAELSELAYHFVQGAPANGCWVKAAKMCIDAASYSEKVLAYDEASKLYDDAVECLRSTPQQDAALLFDTLLCFSATLNRSSLSGNRKRARQVLSEARELAKFHGWNDRLIKATLNVAPDSIALEVGKVDVSLIQMIEETLELLHEEPKTSENMAAYATLLGKLAMALYWDETTYTRRETLLEESLEIAMASKELSYEILARSARHIGLWLPANLQWRLEEAQVIFDKSHVLGDSRLIQISRILLLTDLFESGQIMKSFDVIQKYKKLSEKMQESQFLWIGTLYEGVGSHLVGDLDGMECVAEYCGEIWEQSQDANAHQCMWVNYLISRYERSMVGDILHQADTFMDLNQYKTAPAWHCFKILLSTQTEQKQIAKEGLGQFANNDFKDLPNDMMWPWSMMNLGLTCFALNKIEYAKDILNLLAPFSGRWTVAGYTGGTSGPIDHALGLLCMMLGRETEAEGYFEKALSSAHQSGAVLIETDVRVDFATLLLQMDTGESRNKAISFLHEASNALKPSWRRIQQKILDIQTEIQPRFGNVLVMVDEG